MGSSYGTAAKQLCRPCGTTTVTGRRCLSRTGAGGRGGRAAGEVEGGRSHSSLEDMPLEVKGRRLSPKQKQCHGTIDSGKTMTTETTTTTSTGEREVAETKRSKSSSVSPSGKLNETGVKKTGRGRLGVGGGGVGRVGGGGQVARNNARNQTLNGQTEKTPRTVPRGNGKHVPVVRSGSRISKVSGNSLQERRNTIDVYKMDNLPAVESTEASNVSATRLRKIVKMLRYEDISKFILIKNLEYAATVLEHIYKTETMRICNEEDEDVLSQAPSAKADVPAEVRDWLSSTFTRSLTNMRKSKERFHFRSVANVIRAGIVVDSIKIKAALIWCILELVKRAAEEKFQSDFFRNVDDWTFDVFRVNEIGENHALKYVGYELLQKHGLVNKYKINTQALDNFLGRMEVGYAKNGNTYHNLAHAADVTQTTHHLLSQSGLSMWLSDLEIFAVLFSAMIHDYEHTGTTNAFHINTSSDVALLYNDKAVLENHHVSAAFRLMKDTNFNIISNLSREEHKEFRTVVIDIVLATDMSYHFQQLKIMKNLLTMPENIDKSKALSLLVHCADISHPAKTWALHKNWTELLIEEFFRQGEQEAERNLPISPLCDRKSTMIAESQIGFIDFIVDPSFQVLGDMLDKILAPLMRQQQLEQQQKQQQQITIGDGGNRSNIKKTDSLSSLSGCSSAGSGNASSTSSKSKLDDASDDLPTFQVKRYWVDCLRHNKQCWREQAIKDLALKKAADDAVQPSLDEERIISPNLGIVTSHDTGHEDLKPRQDDVKGHSAESRSRRSKHDQRAAHRVDVTEVERSATRRQTNGHHGGGGSGGVHLESRDHDDTVRSEDVTAGSRHSEKTEHSNGLSTSPMTSRPESVHHHHKVLSSTKAAIYPASSHPPPHHPPHPPDDNVGEDVKFDDDNDDSLIGLDLEVASIESQTSFDINPSTPRPRH